MLCIVSKNFAKTLNLKREFDVTLLRHKQRTPSNNNHHTPLSSLRKQAASTGQTHDKQARYQLGTPEGGEEFLRGAQIF